MSESESDEDCGIIRPSLIKQLKSILDQYPDDGQILKELIQNAEDAGATEITFVYDQHSYGTKKLYHESLDIHQGPGLLAYNNASFTEEDWTGIRSLYESIKENDPLKVGRFGLGFKSVFHLTDLPSILSGQKLLILDPHENILNNKGRPTSGRMWNLKKDKTCLAEFEDQFTPYQGLFGCNIKSLEQGTLRGTLFRFPLRKKPSKLSQTVYHDKRMRTLFESFETDAHLILLFLKRVERIVLSERGASNRKPQERFEVRIAETCRETVRKKRADFLQKVVSAKEAGNPQNHALSSYGLSIEVLQNEDVTNTYHYLIRECYAAGEVSATFKNLRQELETSYVPMVGVAMQLGDGDGETRSEKPVGQTFCVLPLPREQRSSSGLPVHINGYFSVEQNRRHLKWKTSGQHEESDKDVAWNTCLLSELLPVCYVDLIKTAIRCQKEHRGVSIDDVYAAVPNLSLVDEKWQLLVQKVLNLLFQEQWLFTLASGGKWVSIRLSVLDDSGTNDDANIVREVLLATGQNIVTPPPHVSAAVRNSIVKVDPQLIRTALQQNQGSYADLDSGKKMALLGAILQDLTQKGVELHGISLIPLANGTFGTFQDQVSSPVYIPSTDQRIVLQALESQLLEINIAPCLLTSLQTIAKFGRTCLKEVSPTDMPGLIGAVLPQEWQGETVVTDTDHQGPLVQWFEQLWKYLTHSRVSLVAFEGLMIMPLTSGIPMKLITLDKRTTVILAYSEGVKLNGKLQKFLQSLGVFIVDRVPEYVSRHPDVLGTYIKSPTTEHVLKAVLSASKRLGVEQVASLLSSDYSMADELVTLVYRGLESEGYTPPQTETELLKKLPLFPTTRSTADNLEYASAYEVSNSTADNRLLQNLPCRLLLAKTEKTQKVGRFLGANFLSGPSLLRKYIIPCIEQQQISPEQIRDLMVCVSEQLPTIAREDGTLYGDFARVAFVETKSAKLMKPSELFHPGSSFCQKLFSCIENVFPSGAYAEQDMLAILVKMGLKNEKDLQSRDVEKAVLSLQSAPLEEQSTISKSILLALNCKPEFFCRDLSLMSVLRNHPWVPVFRDRIAQYPQSLKWMGSTGLCKPADVVAPKWARMVGSVKAVVSEVVQGLEEIFSWQELPSLHLVVQHLKNVVDSYHLDEKPAYLGIILETYRFFERCSKEELADGLKNCPNWLWVGDQFALAEHVVLEKNFMNLYPFVHSLPEELQFLKHILSGLGFRKNIDNDMPVLVNVLHRIKDVNEKEKSLKTSEQNLPMVVAILNHIRKSITHMDGSLRARLLVPEDCEPGEIFELQLLEDCTYCDKEWLRKGFELKHVDAEKENIKLIHRDIPLDTARDLGVTPLIKRVLHSEQLEITAFGQSESLANRIRQLLEDYTDGLAVFKEMVQNADDAGATEVKFLYDERTNDDARNRLLDPKLEECQGAALWVYNDAEFKEEDFNNIISLGDSSKEKAVDKVGKFGLGFNVVYNLTEVPSFVTGESLVMFDPQISHLSDVIKDKSNPGIKLNIKQNRLLLETCSDQFLPFRNIYGCDLSGESDEYQGTLFRLPLRTAAQASRSKLSPNHYSRTEMIKLLEMLKDNAHRILLFTQNVTNVALDYLPKDGGPDQPIPIFAVQKNVENIVKELSSSKGKVNLSRGISGMLSFVAANAEALDDQSSLVTLIRTTKKELPGSKKLFTKEESSSKRVKGKPEHRHWIISTAIKKQPGLTAGNQVFQIGGIAMLVQKKTDVDAGYLPQSLKDIRERGQFFCGLPLPFYCDLPVHINGNFALHSSRRVFPQGTGDDKYRDKIEWNNCLLKEVLSEAYLQALEDTVQLLPKSACVEFHKLWPLLKVSKKDHEDVSPLLDAFFSGLLVRPDVPLLYDETGLVTMKKAVFLDEQLVADGEIKETVLESMSQLMPGFSPVILPQLAFKQLQKSDQATIAVEKWYDIQRYFKKIVFPSLKKIPDDKREKLVSFALKKGVVRDLKLDALEYVRILSSLKDAHAKEALKPSLLELACSVLICLGIAMQENKTLANDMGPTVFVPNEKHILMPLESLYYTTDGRREKDSIVCKDIPSPTVRAIGIKSWRDFLYDNNSRGIPFGQCEDLPNAIKRVLDTYPRDHEILKELIQNADDAKATKIHFIFDQRQHPSERVFDKSWKPLQGPALCVYSDSSFTKEDLDGIQALGIGAKRHDSSKTGQYGVGFNSVYHITDAPSLLTSGPDVPKTLCVFDPQCNFVRGATPEKPGRQFNDLEGLQDEFPDVFTGYLEDHFPAEHATMLRLPLRNELMASQSLISNRSSPDIETMFSSLAKEAKEALLFLENIKEIEMSVIRSVGKTDRLCRLSCLYKFEARMCEHVQGWKPDTANNCERIIRHLQTKQWSLKSIPLLTSFKCIEIAEMDDCKEKWFVAKTLGLENDVTIPSSVTEMIERGEFRLLPRGGVAAPVSYSTHRHSFKGKAFCTLPLPLETRLPVHVNGHFALGHENRRHLWINSDREAYKQEWNDFLCENVISVAYVRLLEALKELVSDKTTARETLIYQLRQYLSYFPFYTDEGRNWHVLIKACYKRLASAQVPTLPVVLTPPAAVKEKWKTMSINDFGTVEWNTFHTDGRLKVYFPETPTSIAKKESGTIERMEKKEKAIKEKHVLHQCLVRCHFAVLEITEEIARGFEQSDVQITRLSPGEVLSGLPLRPLCKPGTLPKKIEKTPIQNEVALKTLVKYCAQDEQFVEALEQMPFLLTADGQLHKFDPESPAYYTSFQSIFPLSADMFIKDSVFGVFKKCSPCSVMRPFQIAQLPWALKSNLPPTLSAASEIRMEEAIKLREWSQKLFPELPPGHLVPYEIKISKTEKLNDWLGSLWNFVGEQLKDLLEKPERRHRLSYEEREKIKRMWLTKLKRQATLRLKCIENWCLIPTEKLHDTYLVSIRRSSMVLGRGGNDSVFKILLGCGVHVLHRDYESSSSYFDQPKSTLSKLVTTTEDARACLHILHSALQESSTTLKDDDARKLRTFFCENLEMLKNNKSSASELKDLPIYKSVFGRLSDLSGYNVAYQLPEGTPTAGLEVSQTTIGTLFLECDNTFESLYRFLGVELINRVFFYRDFIFQHFEMYSEEERSVHLWYVHRYTRQKGDNENSQLLEVTKDVPIITDTDGSLKQGNSFYDQHNPVFAAFMSEFAPPRYLEPFGNRTWHEFLSNVGLVTELSPEVFLSCAHQVALQRPCDQTLARSKVLMKYIFDMKRNSQQQTTDVFSDQDFDKLSKIAFVEPAPVSAQLKNLGPEVVSNTGFMELSGAIPSEHGELVWTQVALLPTWADPYFAPLDPESRDELRKVLGILEKPCIFLVLKHLCALAENLSSIGVKRGQSQLTQQIFKKIYQYLQQQDEEIPSMHETECILVEKGKNLVAPKQIVRTLPQQIAPFLYQIPDDMMAYQALFMRLGGTERATVGHYVMVLEKLYIETKSGATLMSLNQTKRAFLAVKGLFGTLDYSNDVFPNEPLYLPSVDGMMCLSTKLVYNDAPSLFSRFKNLKGKQLVNLAECGLASSQVVGAVEKLPKQHQPRFVSQEVEETLNGSNQIHEESDVANQVTTRVRSEVFREAVKQLLFHEDFSHNRRPEKREIQEAVDRLERVQVQSVDRVQTVLRNKKTRGIIPDSSADKVCHVEKRKIRDSYHWDVYIKGCLSLNELLIPLAKAINLILDGKLQTSVLNLFPLITCPEGRIVEVLKGFDVNVGAMGVNQQNPVLPSPGKELYPAHRNIITPGDSRRIRVDDYVAVAFDSSDSPIYAIVLAIPDETDMVFVLDIGRSEPLEVEAGRIFTI